MIKSFQCKETKTLFNDINVPKFKAIERTASNELQHPKRDDLQCKLMKMHPNFTTCRYHLMENNY